MFNEISGYDSVNLIKNYGLYPRNLPSFFHFEHGWTVLSEPLKTDLELAEPKDVMFVFSARRAKAWKKHSKVPAAIIGAPFVHFRRTYKVNKSKSAVGTVAFPAHPTGLVDADFDIDEYCTLLKELPDEFQPVTICLHWSDIVKETNLRYEEKGFKVVTAGELGSSEFAQKFYAILANHKYATSNQVGTYTLYSVEMGIPFFVLGEPAVMVNHGGDINVPERYTILDYPLGQFTTQLFSTGPTTTITQEQRDFVNSELGLNDCISRTKLHFLLWKTLAERVVKFNDFYVEFKFRQKLYFQIYKYMVKLQLYIQRG